MRVENNLGQQEDMRPLQSSSLCKGEKQQVRKKADQYDKALSSAFRNKKQKAGISPETLHQVIIHEGRRAVRCRTDSTPSAGKLMPVTAAKPYHRWTR